MSKFRGNGGDRDCGSEFEHVPPIPWTVTACDDPDNSIPQWLPLRLRVLQTSILHQTLSLAVLDAYSETQFGRDVAPLGSDTPRIRLKEMPVSKLHATVFWDKARREWAVVDMGSKHGTFLQSAHHPGVESVRLSPPRVASIPRPLRHLDRLIIGSTTFLCHIHEDRTPCAECTSTSQGVIPLFAVPRENNRAAEKRPPDVAGMTHAQEARDAKKALTSLRRTLLARLDPHHEHPSTSAQPPASYIDRSARRRAMHPSSQFDSPGVQSSRSSSPGPMKSSRELSQTPSSGAIEEERAPPLPEHNIGWRLLMKQGWQPGTSLGSTTGDMGDGEGSGLVEPIEVHPTPYRAGIGMPQKVAVAPLSFQEWKVTGRERWWESIQPSDEAG
ncbi:hypothetical protein J3R83DRAFT_11907 [Lanmaoa asiatica]|nr:hypothetical protein J3R83DRAFT_11907 [Lanmaoa asiatica]